MTDVSSRRLFGLGLSLGIVLRLWPILAPGRLFQHWPTEDGYLTLTIARSIGSGLGMTVSDGTVATNGTQPLATSLYAIGFFLGGGSREFGVGFALGLQVLFGALTCWLLYRTVLEVLADDPRRHAVATVSSLVWYLNPVLIPHTQNCLETGLYLLLSLLVWKTWHRGLSSRDGQFGLRGAVRLGLLMGLCAWGRVDAVFLMFGLGVAQLTWGLSAKRYRVTIVELSVMAALAAASIFPWLLSGKLRFGYWVPVSGVAEGSSAHFGGNLPLLPAKLFEYIVGLVGVPSALEEHPVAALSFAVLVAGWIALAIAVLRSARRSTRYLALAVGIQALGLSVYYGMFFGASHFLSRYVAPLSLFTIPMSTFLVIAAWQRLTEAKQDVFARLARPVGALAGVGVLLLLLGQYARHARRAVPHMHWQVIEWVDAHVPEDVWVGAIQTGTLGFFHDRTLNLDGKVDVRALHAALANRTPAYIADSKLDAIVDWYGSARWLGYPEVGERFRLVVDSAEENLTVLVRRGSRLDQSLQVTMGKE